jgi:hypothetical protein
MRPAVKRSFAGRMMNEAGPAYEHWRLVGEGFAGRKKL